MDETNRPIDPNRRMLMAGAVAAVGGTVLGTGGAQGRVAAQPRTADSSAVERVTGRRRLGALEVSPIGMGVQNMSRTFHGTIPTRPEMIRIIQAAHDGGVRFFDTAEVYGPHECERFLGEAAQSFRNDIVIASKFGFNVDLQTGRLGPGLISRPEHIKRVVEGSLRRLRTDRIDLLYQHRVDPTVPIEDVAGAVGDLRRDGKVLHWGLSEMGLTRFAERMRSCPSQRSRANIRCCGAGRSGPFCRPAGN
jgi:aryl-alcohol dehydrogenase-like predicted oxidoreductase